MHIVTKVLVLLAAVLAVVLASLTMAYSINAGRIVQDYQDLKTQKEATETQADQAKSQHQAEQARLNGLIDQLQNDRVALDGRIRGLQAENSKLLIQANKVALSEEQFRNEVARWEATIATQTKLIESYRGEVTRLRDDELQYRRREIELVDRINDLESAREVLAQTTRALQESLADLQDRYQRLVASGGTGLTSETGADETFAYTGPLIQGRVLKTMRDDATGNLLAQIDLGTNDQVRENMLLYIGRGDTFLAHVKIIRTDLEWSVGIVDTLGRDVTIQDGDVVRSTLLN